MSETRIGKIKFFNLDRGFGFIKTDIGDDFFYHVSDLVDQNYTPRPDDKVRFIIATGKRGLKATQVQACH